MTTTKNLKWNLKEGKDCPPASTESWVITVSLSLAPVACCPQHRVHPRVGGAEAGDLMLGGSHQVRNYWWHKTNEAATSSWRCVVVFPPRRKTGGHLLSSYTSVLCCLESHKQTRRRAQQHATDWKWRNIRLPIDEGMSMARDNMSVKHSTTSASKPGTSEETHESAGSTNEERDEERDLRNRRISLLLPSNDSAVGLETSTEAQSSN